MEICLKLLIKDSLLNSLDHRDQKIINKCQRFQALGHRHPREACYILCSSKCVDFSQRKEVRELEADAAQKVLISSAGVLAGTTTTGTANDARAPAAPALLPGRDASNDPPEWYHTVRLHIPVRRAYFLDLRCRSPEKYPRRRGTGDGARRGRSAA